MKKLLIYLITVLLLSISVYAYDVDITWNFDQTDYDYEAYTCLDNTCSTVNPVPILTGNSGASISVNTVYTATGTSRTAFYFYADNTDDLFRVKGAIVTTRRAFNATVNDVFNKKNSCQAVITDVSTVPLVLDSGMDSIINVNVNSPFSVSDSGAGTPLFRAASRANFFGADTVVNVNVTNNAGTVVFSDSQTITLDEDETRNISFNWSNMPQGNFTIIADTQVIDNQCDLTNALTDSRQENVTVADLNDLPIANAGPDRTVGVNRTVTFDGSLSSDSDGSITSYFWDFGDGSNASGQIVTHNFTTRGNFTVTLTVTDNDGATDSDTAFIQVDGIPTAVISGSSSGFTNQVLSFNAGQSTDDGNITSYIWSFGDGSTANGVLVTHAYLNPGTYTVTLTVIDNNNLSDTDSLTVTITQQTSTGGESSSRRRGSSKSSVNRHDVRITDVVMDKTLVCGVPGKVQLHLSNTGDFDEKRIMVSVGNSELGVKEFTSLDIEEAGKRLIELRFEIEENVESGEYPLMFEINFGRGVDIITQNVGVQCNPNIQQEIVESFVASSAGTDDKEIEVNVMAVITTMLVLIVVVLAIIYFLW